MSTLASVLLWVMLVVLAVALLMGFLLAVMSLLRAVLLWVEDRYERKHPRAGEGEKEDPRAQQ